mmetsp:Transcript_21837/g.21130  ORF Transcript_21837/g.21130 Transcript_21837/m.21130 type:complete len:325 (-) Transcript_21837:64-1038(-)
MCKTKNDTTVSDDSSSSVGKKDDTTLVDIARDMALLRPANVHKLMTKEDGHYGHVHKMIGSAALAHYIYRTYLLVTTGTMQFDSSMVTLYCILLHMLLSVSSFIFKIPNNRINSAPMIYPEFRLHSIIFAYRSLIVMILMWGSKRYESVVPLYLRGAVVILTMVAADKVTSTYKDQGTTMRAMPFPAYISPLTRDRLNVFYSVCQIFATSQVLFSYHLDEVFAVVFPIQIAALLMTMVRKSIISAGAWHYYYSLSLLSNFVVGPIAGWFNPATTPGGFFFPSALIFCALRFNVRGLNKYMLWGIVCLTQVYAMVVLNRYTSVVV